MKIKDNNSGLTVIETMVSAAIFIVVLGIITTFLFSSTAYSNRLNLKSVLADNLRNTNIRLEKEIEQCAVVLSSYQVPTSYASQYGTSSTIYTNQNRLILARRVLNRNNYLPAPDDSSTSTTSVSNRNDPAYNDIIIIDYDGNYANNNISSTTAATQVQSGKILISLIPATSLSSTNYFTSKPSIKRVLSANITNSSDNTSYTTTTSLKPFRYYDSTSSEKVPASSPPYLSSAVTSSISMLNVNLYGRRDYGSYKVRQNTDYRVSLRGYTKPKN